MKRSSLKLFFHSGPRSSPSSELSQAPFECLLAWSLPFPCEMEPCHRVDVSYLLGDSDLILFFISTVAVWLRYNRC